MLESFQQRASRAARRIGMKAAIGLVAAVLATAGLVFLLDAAWRRLAIAYDAIIASTLLGLGLMVAALLLLLIAGAVGRSERRAPPPPPRPDPVYTDAEMIAMILRAFSTGKNAGRGLRGDDP